MLEIQRPSYSLFVFALQSHVHKRLPVCCAGTDDSICCFGVEEHEETNMTATSTPAIVLRIQNDLCSDRHLIMFKDSPPVNVVILLL
jgi:hypothetical protein